MIIPAAVLVHFNLQMRPVFAGPCWRRGGRSSCAQTASTFSSAGLSLPSSTPDTSLSSEPFSF